MLTVLGDTKPQIFTTECYKMKVLHRKPVNKYKSAKRFRGSVSRTKAANMQMAPQRGGWRL
jgi:hypothetical protein